MRPVALLAALLVGLVACARESRSSDAADVADASDMATVLPGCSHSITPTGDASFRAADGESFCSAGGWCWEDSLPHGNRVAALWSDAPDDVWTIANGEVVRWDGTAWLRVPMVFGAIAVSGTSRVDVWVAGLDTTQTLVTSHWDGTSWSPPIPIGPGSSGVRALWSHAVNDVWLLSNAVYHWDGTSWTDRSPAGGEWWHLWHTANEPWVYSSTDQLERWDGTAWQVVPLPAPLTSDTAVSALSGVDSSDVWAVLQGGSAAHWNGSTWAVSPVPSDAMNGFWMAVVAFRANDVWVSGWDQNYFPVLRHWNGLAWLPAEHVDVHEGRLADSRGGSAWIFGDRGRVLVRDGATWSVRSGATTIGNVLTVFSMSGTAADDVWAAGAQSNGSTNAGVIVHRDASGWHPSTVLPDVIGSVWANARDDVWAIAGGTLVHFNGIAWSNVTAPIEPTERLSRFSPTVWSSGRDDVWIADESQLVHGDGTSWTIVTPDVGDAGTWSETWGVSGTRRDDVWVVGGWSGWGRGELIVQHWDGRSWHAQDLGQASGSQWGPPSVRIHAFAADDVWIYGDLRHALHWNGTQWRERDELNATEQMWGRCGSDFWFSGRNGAASHWDGRMVTSTQTGTDPSAMAGWEDVTGSVWIGTSGGILRRELGL